MKGIISLFSDIDIVGGILWGTVAITIILLAIDFFRQTIKRTYK